MIRKLSLKLFLLICPLILMACTSTVKTWQNTHPTTPSLTIEKGDQLKIKEEFFLTNCEQAKSTLGVLFGGSDSKCLYSLQVQVGNRPNHTVIPKDTIFTVRKIKKIYDYDRMYTILYVRSSAWKGVAILRAGSHLTEKVEKL
ncbi:hypothetical protein F2A31_03270 [Acinetobacter suaedae]|uniref:Lipoprotein n=1 Tax=Acinetobacter suaedae TaxID=2609668 RepID=A0A5P1UQ98_9GAMM|nr:hypothetical protein [Acinetobacter sp. C16S1]QER38774.1 hypothetical protein F2A31_03270 [Acinetobacter sp. C16S1]